MLKNWDVELDQRRRVFRRFTLFSGAHRTAGREYKDGRRRGCGVFPRFDEGGIATVDVDAVEGGRGGGWDADQTPSSLLHLQLLKVASTTEVQSHYR